MKRSSGSSRPRRAWTIECTSPFFLRVTPACGWGEVVALEWGRVVFARNVLVIAVSEWRGEVTATKGGKVREVEMTARLAAALKEHGKVRRLDTERVITRDDGTPFHRESFRSRMRSVERRAGLPVTGRFHILRHTFCARLAMRGAPAKAIQELVNRVN